MAELIQGERQVRVKIVYYGPALSGKTTNLKLLHGRAMPGRRGQLLSLNSQQERTILFDMLPLRAVGPHGYELALQLVAVPGQSFYVTTRRVALRGVDGVVFVANSAADRLQDNLHSFLELKRLLVEHGLDPQALPLVLQCNKQDLPKTLAPDKLDVALRGAVQRRSGPPPVGAVATRGEGVIASFEAVLAATLADVARRFRVLALPQGQTAEQWARRAALGLFGQGSLTAGGPRGPRLGLPHGDFGIPAELDQASY
jgi:hypothetical protein